MTPCGQKYSCLSLTKQRSVSPALLARPFVWLPMPIRALQPSARPSCGPGPCCAAAAAAALSVRPPRSGTAPITSCFTLAPNLLLSPPGRLVAYCHKIPCCRTNPVFRHLALWLGHRNILLCACRNQGQPPSPAAFCLPQICSCLCRLPCCLSQPEPCTHLSAFLAPVHFLEGNCAA